MKINQWFSEYLLANRSKILPSSFIKQQYLKLLLQTELKDRLIKPELKKVADVSFFDINLFDKTLRCFDRKSVVSLFREIFIYQHYNPPVDIGKNPVIFDVGANIGLFSIFASMVFDKPLIKTFEADPTTFEILQYNVSLFEKLSKIELSNVALSNEVKTSRMIVNLDNPNRCTNTIVDGFYGNKSNTDNSREISCARLSSYIAEVEAVDMLKMDIEGSEFAVFDDLRDNGCLSKIRCLIMEVHRNVYENPKSGHNLSNLINVLEQNNFSFDIFAQGQRPFSLGRLDETFMLRAFNRDLS